MSLKVTRAVAGSHNLSHQWFVCGHRKGILTSPLRDTYGGSHSEHKYTLLSGDRYHFNQILIVTLLTHE